MAGRVSSVLPRIGPSIQSPQEDPVSHHEKPAAKKPAAKKAAAPKKAAPAKKKK
jgi:hypothetical protein